MKKCYYPFILLFFAFSLLFAQGRPLALEKAEKKTVIDSVCANLDREYIFPEFTQKYIAELKENFRQGRRIFWPMPMPSLSTSDRTAVVPMTTNL